MLDEVDIARFWERVDSSGGPDSCWVWQGSKTYSGHGMTQWMGAHRLAYIVTYGSVPPKLVVMHQCHNPICCNPAHLKAGTASENMQAMIARGRKPRRHREGGRWNGKLVY